MGYDFQTHCWLAFSQPISLFRHNDIGIHLVAFVEFATMDIDRLMLACFLQACLGGELDMFMPL